MSFDQMFVIAIAITVAASMATVMIAVGERRSRRAQRHSRYIFAPAAGQSNSDDTRGAGQNSELLYSVSRLG